MMRRIIATATIAGALVLTAAAAVAVSRFTDVGDDHPSAAEIEAAAAEGWMLGYGDETFGPDQTLTESQFRKVLSRVFDDLKCPTDECEGITRAEAAVFVVAGADAVKARRANPVVDEPGGEPGEEPGGEPGEEPTVTQPPVVDEPGGEPGDEPGGGPTVTDEPTVTQPPPTSAPPVQAAPSPEERCLRIIRSVINQSRWHTGWRMSSTRYYNRLFATGAGDDLQCLTTQIASPQPGLVRGYGHLYTIEVYDSSGEERRRVMFRQKSGAIYQTEEKQAEAIAEDEEDRIPLRYRDPMMVDSDTVAAFLRARQAGTEPPAVPASFLPTTDQPTNWKAHDPWWD